MKFKRASGILLHPTSLPGPYGVGDLGPAAYPLAGLAGRLRLQTLAGAAARPHRLRRFTLPVFFGLRRESLPDQPGIVARAGAADPGRPGGYAGLG